MRRLAMARRPIGRSLTVTTVYFSCLSSRAFSFVFFFFSFFYQNPLSKPVIAANEYSVEYTNTNESRGTAQRSPPLNPSILSGALSRASRALQRSGETRKKKKTKERGQRDKAREWVSRDNARRARTRRKISSLARYSFAGETGR